MKDSELLSHLWAIKSSGRLANYNMETGQEIAAFNRQVVASHLVNHDLATIDNGKWRLTQLGLQALQEEGVNPAGDRVD